MLDKQYAFWVCLLSLFQFWSGKCQESFIQKDSDEKECLFCLPLYLSMPSLTPGTENMLIHASRRKKGERKEEGMGSRKERGKEGREGMKKERKSVRWIGWIQMMTKDTKSLLFQENKSKQNLAKLRWQESKYFKDFSEIEFTKLESWLWGWQRQRKQKNSKWLSHFFFNTW